MTGNRYVRFGQLQHNDPKFGRLLAVSLALHVIFMLAFQLATSSRFAPPKKTVYYVDLTQLPVKDPQAGRPTPPAPKPKVPPPATRKPAAVTPPPTPAPKPEPKPAPKPPPKPAVTSTPRKDTTKEAIEKMRREAAIEKQKSDIEKKLAAFRKEDTREAAPAPTSDAPLGSETGRGTEIGLDQQIWLKAMIKEQWNLSRYQIDNLDLEAVMEMVYSAEGKLLDYSFAKRSKNQLFDDSILRTMLKMEDIVLPVPPERRTTIKVVFNLKELMR